MTTIHAPTSYMRIEDELDRLGQRMRVRRLARGGMRCLATLVATTVALGAAAHWVPAGSPVLWALLIVWIFLSGGAVIAWVIKPLTQRFDAVRVARLIEQRDPSLHNGLTNSVLLARRDDVQTNPWIEPIFDEVGASLNDDSLRDPAPWSELRRMTIVCATIVIVGAVVWAVWPGVIGHGVRQLFSPSTFVPRTGAAKLVGVMPGDVTLVTGEALEVSAVAEAPTGSTAIISFRNGPSNATLLPIEQLKLQRYTYRLDHVDSPMSYRLDVGGTQSRWYHVNVVKAIGLSAVTVTTVPPAYTGLKASTLSFTQSQLRTQQLSAPQGSRISIGFDLDSPVNSALLQNGSAQPKPMTTDAAHRQFHSSISLSDDTNLALLATNASGEILATLPDPPLAIHCINDTSPSIGLRWPTQDMTVSPTMVLHLKGSLHDDYGLTKSQVLIGYGDDGAMMPLKQFTYPAHTASAEIDLPLTLPANRKTTGSSIRLQVQATDNCGLKSGPQTSSTSIYTIQFQDPDALAKQQMQSDQQLRQKLQAMLAEQIRLNKLTVADKPFRTMLMRPVASGQSRLLDQMRLLASTFDFDISNRIAQKTLQVLVLNPGKDAVEQAKATLGKTVPNGTMGSLLSSQRQIIDSLQSLLAALGPGVPASTQPSTTGNDPLLSKADAFKALDSALKKYEAEQRKILDQTAGLAKTPVDDFSNKDMKLLNSLLQHQDNLDAFMQEKIADFSKLAEQDMANASMVKDAMSIMTEVTLAKNALKAQATQIAVPAEESGLEGAKELSSNLERWLSNTPDRTQWTQEELPQHSDTPMPELPAELQDMMGKLIEQQEDLFDQVEDMNANITDSADKGIGWDAADGPIADMSAKGVTGNVLPNNNEMGGRSGEGRSGQSQGEFVGNTAVGKGGRNTPTRLDPTPFQQRQINDTSKDPVGGATGGGKLSGSGGAGLEGPVPPKLSADMKRLATQQADIRNTAERIALRYKVGNYDNFKLQQSIALMRRVQSALDANRYRTAMRQRDVLLEKLDTSRLLLSAQLHVQQDTTPSTSIKQQQELNDANKADLPPAWSDSLKAYYQKLASQ